MSFYETVTGFRRIPSLPLFFLKLFPGTWTNEDARQSLAASEEKFGSCRRNRPGRPRRREESAAELRPSAGPAAGRSSFGSLQECAAAGHRECRSSRENDHRISSAMTMITHSASNISIMTRMVSNIWPLPECQRIGPRTRLLVQLLVSGLSTGWDSGEKRTYLNQTACRWGFLDRTPFGVRARPRSENCLLDLSLLNPVRRPGLSSTVSDPFATTGRAQAAAPKKVMDF
jgi:hypothetical protein